MNRKTTVASLMALFFLASVFASGGDKVKGMIIARTGETLIVSSGGAPQSPGKVEEACYAS